MIRFDSDYIEGAHPSILAALTESNFEQHIGYGCDDYCERARNIIREHCGDSTLGVQFLVGGTQANVTVIDAMLRSYQGVISADSGHINVHETGAPEATGHKVIALPTSDGRLTVEQIAECYHNHWNDFSHEHTVQPGMVYLSCPAENGLIYSKAELTAISDFCHSHGLYLFVDGARLGYGLCSKGCDVTLADLARLCDVFYIGGTKCGTLFGEALVVTNRALLKHLFPLVKQHGALLAKGRLLGVQFGELFRDGLYEQLGKQAVRLALRVSDALRNTGYSSVIDSPTNQQFFTLPNDLIDRLREHISFDYWGPRGDSESAVRFVTSWATTKEDIERIKQLL